MATKKKKMNNKNLTYLGLAVAAYFLLFRKPVNGINGTKTYLFEYTYQGNVLTTAEFNARNLKEAKLAADRYKRMELRNEFSYVPFNRIKTTHTL